MTDAMPGPLTVGQVAEQFAVTVRTLHHYDDLGLLTPSERTRGGYRSYSRADLDRLSTIVVYRRLGFSLEQIAALLAGPDDLIEHLHRQRANVTSQLGQLRALVTAIDNALEAAMSKRPATRAELQELFGDGFDEAHEREAEERWGDTPAWTQTRSRTASYTPADWTAIRAEADAVDAAFVDAYQPGAAAGSPAAREAARAHRAHLHERFYDVDAQLHRGLGEMYVADPRFAATYDALAPGLAVYVRDAINAHADHQGE